LIVPTIIAVRVNGLAVNGLLTLARLLAGGMADIRVGIPIRNRIDGL
jgi:hypothetical protein